MVTVVNAFTRVSGPDRFESGGMAGFGLTDPAGVPWGSELSRTGRQVEFMFRDLCICRIQAFSSRPQAEKARPRCRCAPLRYSLWALLSAPVDRESSPMSDGISPVGPWRLKVDMMFSLHSDAGTTETDETVGTMGIFFTDKGKRFRSQRSRPSPWFLRRNAARTSCPPSLLRRYADGSPTSDVPPAPPTDQEGICTQDKVGRQD